MRPHSSGMRADGKSFGDGEIEPVGKVAVVGPFAVGAEIGDRAFDLDDDRARRRGRAPECRRGARWRAGIRGGSHSRADRARGRRRGRKQRSRVQRCRRGSPINVAVSVMPVMCALQQEASKYEGYREAEAKLGFCARHGTSPGPIGARRRNGARALLPRRRRRAEPDRGVAQCPPQSVEQRFLRRAAGIRLAEILVAVRRSSASSPRPGSWSRSISSICARFCRSAGGAG